MPLFLRLTVDTNVTWEQGLSYISKSKKSTSTFYISRRRTARLYISTVAIPISCFKSLLLKSICLISNWGKTMKISKPVKKYLREDSETLSIATVLLSIETTKCYH